MSPLSFSMQARLLAHLSEDLKVALTQEWVDDWRREFDESHLLAHTAMGQIRWKKSIGRPSGPLASGFELLEEYCERTLVGDGFGGAAHWQVLPAPTIPWPIAWDGPDDEEYHRVTYVSLNTKVTGKTPDDAPPDPADRTPFNRMTVTLVEANWPSTGERGVRYVERPRWAFQREKGELVVHEPVDVLFKSIWAEKWTERVVIEP
jgi:hypothetical protein